MNKITTAVSKPLLHVLPGSLAQVGTVTKYELVNYFRSRRFFVLLLIGLIISGLLTFLVAYLGISTFAATPLGFYLFWWGGLIPLIIAINGIAFGGDAISGEFQNKTGYFLVPNPLRRSSVYIGKWIGALIASLMIFAVFAAITIGNGLYYFGMNVPVQFGESLLFSILYLASVLGFTFFFSSLFKSSSMSILITALLFLFVFNLIQLIVNNFAHVEPWFIISYGSTIIGNVLEDPYPTTQVVRRGPGGGEFSIYSPTVVQGLTIMAGYFVITAILGLVLFERKEFT